MQLAFTVALTAMFAVAVDAAAGLEAIPSTRNASTAMGTADLIMLARLIATAPGGIG
jgi:hypothetical protein